MFKVLSPTSYSDVDSLDGYLATVNRAPMLSAEEEFRLAYRFRDEHDREAAEQLVTSHLRLVVRVAKGYAGYGLALSDLVQEGSIGLMTAVKRFDPDRGIRLAAFAIHFVRSYIHDFILRNWRIVKTATTKAQRKLFFNLRSQKQRLDRLTRSERTAIASRLNVPAEEVETMDTRLHCRDVAIGPYEASRAATWTGSVIEDVPDTDSDVLEALLQGEARWYSSAAVERGLECLDARSRDVIRRRWLQEEKQTLAEIGEGYGISKERIRQIEATALRKLRDALGAPEPTARADLSDAHASVTPRIQHTSGRPAMAIT